MAAGILKKGFVFHLVQFYAVSLTWQLNGIESSLCNRQGEGFRVRFKRVFQSDR